MILKKEVVLFGNLLKVLFAKKKNVILENFVRLMAVNVKNAMNL